MLATTTTVNNGTPASPHTPRPGRRVSETSAITSATDIHTTRNETPYTPVTVAI